MADQEQEHQNPTTTSEDAVGTAEEGAQAPDAADPAAATESSDEKQEPAEGGDPPADTPPAEEPPPADAPAEDAAMAQQQETVTETHEVQKRKGVVLTAPAMSANGHPARPGDPIYTGSLDGEHVWNEDYAVDDWPEHRVRRMLAKGFAEEQMVVVEGNG